MAQSAPARTKINTKVTQPAPGRSSRRPAGRPGPGRPPKGPRVSGDARDSVRQSARPVIELDFGILVYPPETDGEPWRAVFTENGQRKYRQGATEAKLAEKLEKVRERLQAGAANMERPGADLIKHYLDPDRLPVVVPQARPHPAAAVRAVRRAGHRRRDVPGHQDRPHAADRQRRAHSRGRRPGARDALRARRGGDRGRVPGQPAAGHGALAGRGPPGARPAGDRVRGSRRCGSTPPRSRPTATSASSAGRWPRAGTGSGMS